MSISSSHHDLFRQPSAGEKISLVRSLMETGDLNADVAMALLKSIHSELAQPQGQDHSLYASYARLMASLQHELPEVHEHVVANWQSPQRAEPEEASVEEEPLETEIGGEAKRTETSNVEETGQGGEFWEAEGETEVSESESIEEAEGSESTEKDEEEQENEERDDEEPGDEEPKPENKPEEENQEEEKEVAGLEEAEPEEEHETKAEQLEESPVEPSEPEEPQEHAEVVEEFEKPKIEVNKEVGESPGGEQAEEGERMATEAAEAAAHMEHAESETEVLEQEEPGEEEPPTEAIE